MYICESVSLFSLDCVHSWECWLTCVCAHKEGHHFLDKWFQSGEICFRHQIPEVSSTCFKFSFENVVGLQLYHFTLQSSTVRWTQLVDTLCERGHIHIERIFNKVENLLMLIHITESGLKFPSHLLQDFNKSYSYSHILQLTAGTVDGSELWRRWNSPHVQSSASRPESCYFWVLIPVPFDVWCNGNWLWISSLFFMRPMSPFSLPRMLGAPPMPTLASFDQYSFLSLKNVRREFKMSSPLVWPRRGSKHSIFSQESFFLGEPLRNTQLHNIHHIGAFIHCDAETRCCRHIFN